MMASASISTSMSGETSAETCTIEQAGRIVAEDLAVGATDGFPLRDVGDEDAGSDDVLESGAGLFEGGGDVRESLARLGGGIADADDSAVGPEGRRAGDVNRVADAHRPRVADDRLPRRAGRDVQSGFAIHADAPVRGALPCAPTLRV